jgi:hypothetical protein
LGSSGEQQAPLLHHQSCPFEVELTASTLGGLAETGREGSFARAVRSFVTAAATPSTS